MTLRLPKSVESDPRGPQLLRDLTTHTRPLRQGSEIGIPVAGMTRELAEALRSAYSAGQVVRSLENAERKLAAEERGLEMADRQIGVPRGVRVSRLLLLANDGAERFYRQIEALLRRHGPRVLAVRLEIDEHRIRRAALRARPRRPPVDAGAQAGRRFGPPGDGRSMGRLRRSEESGYSHVDGHLAAAIRRFSLSLYFHSILIARHQQAQ